MYYCTDHKGSCTIHICSWAGLFWLSLIYFSHGLSRKHDFLALFANSQFLCCRRKKKNLSSFHWSFIVFYSTILLSFQLKIQIQKSLQFLKTDSYIYSINIYVYRERVRERERIREKATTESLFLEEWNMFEV